MNPRALAGGSVPRRRRGAARGRQATGRAACGDGIDGPLIVEEFDTTVVVLPDRRACPDDHDNLALDATETA